MSKAQEARIEREAAIIKLREMIQPGDRVRTILRHVSRSGMQRSISLHILLCGDGPASGGPELFDISYLAARAMEEKHDRGGVKVGGCGTDMGFDLVYRLSRVLFRDGFDCAGENCPSNDHSNGDRNYEPHRHSDPGYALRHQWI